MTTMRGQLKPADIYADFSLGYACVRGNERPDSMTSKASVTSTLKMDRADMQMAKRNHLMGNEKALVECRSE